MYNRNLYIVDTKMSYTILWHKLQYVSIHGSEDHDDLARDSSAGPSLQRQVLQAPVLLERLSQGRHASLSSKSHVVMARDAYR